MNISIILNKNNFNLINTKNYWKKLKAIILYQDF